MLQYLQAHSRPDITYAVSQCARFVHSPRRSHEIALEKIGMYLKGTLDQGLILRPKVKDESLVLDIDCYVDADFAGLYSYEEVTNPVSVKSRTGFVVCIADCPVIWFSRLQPSIATSTMHAEYQALSTAMKSVIPFQETVRALAKAINLNSGQITTFKTTIWEDNVGCMTLANLEPGQVTPASKHYAIKLHWFRSHIKKGETEVAKIDTKDQKADVLTKGLAEQQFVHLRKLLCGW